MSSIVNNSNSTEWLTSLQERNNNESNFIDVAISILVYVELPKLGQVQYYCNRI